MRQPHRELLLAIDTSTSMTGLALYDGTIIAELIWRSQQNQTVDLLPAAISLLKQHEWGIDDVNAVAVSLGPGSFNGLRVGLATAKGLCVARGLPCVGVETLAAAALQYAMNGRAIRPIYAAGRGEVATALYREDKGLPRQIEAPRLTTLPRLASEIDVSTLVCGELQPEWIAFLHDRLGSLVGFPPQSGRVRHPACVAELGYLRWRAGESDDVVALQPMYLRRPAITPSARAR